MDRQARSLWVAYALWGLLGVFGAHRFYLGRRRSGAAYVALFLVCFAALFLYVAAIPVTLMAACLLADAAVLPRLVRQANAGATSKPTEG